MKPIEICDSTGKVLGHFIPASAGRERTAVEKMHGVFDLEKAEEVAAKERHGQTTAEVLRYLKSLEPKE
jgi:hypothetical protein